MQTTKRLFESGGKLVAPTSIPRAIALIKEAPLEPAAFDGAGGGVPGGVPGGQLGGVIGGVIGGFPTVAARPVPPPAEVPSKPVRVGGNVRAPKVLYQPAPLYPVLARATHVSGDVVIDAILDQGGNVTDMRIVSGPMLLYQAALTALSQWKYEPTYLNDQPVAVQMKVVVSFRLDPQ